jgi:hypothetical protein
MRILCTFLEGSQRNLLLAVDFEEGIQPRDLKEVRHSLVDLDKFHLASPLPDDAIASDQLAHAVAVYVIHSGEIDQEFPWPWRFNAITFITQSMSAMAILRQLGTFVRCSMPPATRRPGSGRRN